MSRYLIVNADDFGYTPGTSKGIIKAHKQGIVTSTSVMVNMPAAAESVKLALKEAPFLGLGLHLNITAGVPVLPLEEIPDLVNEQGAFDKKQTVVERLPVIDMEQVEQELRAQVTAFSRMAGRPPDHLDSHHHITYLSPPMGALMIELSRDLGVPIRKPFPADEAVAAQLLKEFASLPNDAVAEEMINVLTYFFKEPGLMTTDGFIGEFFGERIALGDLLNFIIDIPEGYTELMCHPAEVDDDLVNTSNYAEPRAKELAALTHPSLREMMITQGITLKTFGDLANARG